MTAIDYAVLSIRRDLLKTRIISFHASAYMLSLQIQNLSAKRKCVDE